MCFRDRKYVLAANFAEMRQLGKLKTVLKCVIPSFVSFLRRDIILSKFT